MIAIKDYENEFTVRQANKAIEIIGELITASQSRMDLLEGVKVEDLQFKGLANTKEKKAEKERLEKEFESKIIERMIDSKGLKAVIQAGVVNKISMSRPDIFAKFAALLFKNTENEVFTHEIYEKRVQEFENMRIKQIKELKVLEVINHFLLSGITGIMDTFQLSMPKVN